jgi:hypothetical protein
MAELYYIQHIGHVGNCALWWRVDAHGYTVNLNEAWRVTDEKAKQICSSRPNEDIPRLVSSVESISQRHADAQSVRELPRCSTCGLQGRSNHPLCESCDTIQDLLDD